MEKFEVIKLKDGTKLYFVDNEEVTAASYRNLKEKWEKEEKERKHYEALEEQWIREEEEWRKKEAEILGESDPETVNHPAHYAEGRKYEPIDVIEDWGLDFCLGNALKYISRAGRKEDYLNDIKKAIWYLEREIKKVQDGIKAKEEWDKMIEEERMSGCENCGKCGAHD